MGKLIPIPGMNDKQAGFTFLEVAESYPWLAKNPGPDELRRMMQTIGRHAAAMAGHVATDPTERFAALLQEASISLRAIASVDPHETASWLTDGDTATSGIGDELLAIQIGTHDEELSISRELAAISSRAQELQAAILKFQERHRTVLAHAAGDEEPLRREFIVIAAKVWRTTTGKRPTHSKTGPFTKFCTVAWRECGFPLPQAGKSLAGSMGASILRYLPKLPQQITE